MLRVLSASLVLALCGCQQQEAPTSGADGMRADLPLLGADPLEDAANLKQIAGVMVRGRWVPRAMLHERLEAIRSEHWR